MLKGINPILSPSLLKVLAEMGHGEELVLADAHFPGHSSGASIKLRADGLFIPSLLKGIIPLFDLDSYDDPLIMMAAVKGDILDPNVESEYLNAIRISSPDAPNPIRLNRFDFYKRADQAYACVITGTTFKYGNIILKKGVTSC